MLLNETPQAKMVNALIRAYATSEMRGRYKRNAETAQEYFRIADSCFELADSLSPKITLKDSYHQLMDTWTVPVWRQ